MITVSELSKRYPIQGRVKRIKSGKVNGMVGTIVEYSIGFNMADVERIRVKWDEGVRTWVNIKFLESIPDTTKPRMSEFYKSLTPYMATAIAEGFCEGEGATRDQQIAAWQYLHDTKQAYSLQGWFGRQAQSMIQEGIIEK